MTGVTMVRAEELIEAQGLVAALELATQVVARLASDFPTWSLPESEVSAGVAGAQQLAALSQTLTAVLATEAHSRSLGSGDGLSRIDWLKAQAPALDGGGGGVSAPALALVGAAMTEPRWAALSEKVISGRVSVAQAAVVLRLHQDVARIADREHLDGIITAIVENIEHLSVKQLGRVAAQARAALKPPAELDREDEGRRLGRALSKVGTVAGFTEYLLRLDPEGAAILDAAIDPLARPRPELAWTGETSADPRTAATRRADALLELVGRAVAAPHGVTRTPRTRLVVTMTLDALLEQVRGAGLADNDAVLSPGTVRRLACEAQIIPAVLGGPSQVLDQGFTERYFTAAQRLALARRDQGCSFPGCTIPPQWCDAHHVQHWSRGGPTDLANGALLCGRHHTIVHQRDLTADVRPDGVTWLTAGHPITIGPRAPRLPWTGPPPEGIRLGA
ncbi:HNH endonuclease [Intrasporangium calvum]|uniref:HNH endonuclease n=1 Tax=Intrasporangium calvum TaxID=53358 RepID=A0ABT5GJI8_9MICO|nr:HNH endonuclease signature motif containing protein [Intrasporangium calvum]MDC5698408.1 HNH endonuclease [Intrasporangium calvum]